MDLLIGNPLLVLFVAIGAGLVLGRIQLFGLSLGSSGVIFVALLLGHLGCSVPDGIGAAGLVLFLYSVGIGAGARFFSSIARHGSRLALLALIIVGVGALATAFFGRLLGLPPDLAAGIFAGALTSTPALAAATDLFGEGGSGVAIGYGIAYPFGVIGVVLFVQLLPRLLGQDLQTAGESLQSGEQVESSIRGILVEITNPNIVGQRIVENPFLATASCQVTRVLEGERLVPLRYDHTFSMGQVVHAVGQQTALGHLQDYLGRPAQKTYLKDVEQERRQLVVTKASVAGKTIREIDPVKNHQVVISRISRLGITFVPDMDTVVERNDVLTVVGAPDALKGFAQAVGHRDQAFDETDLLSLAVGIALGVIVSQLALQLEGGGSLSLGLAGGPLVVGLVLGHFGRVGRIIGHIPRSTRLLLQELGLVFFLADAGIRGGGALVETVHQYGLTVFLMGAVITLLPMAIAYPVGRWLLRLNILQALGSLCGGMTSTPALGAISGQTDSQIPVVSYATTYPVALILMTFFVEFVVRLLS